MPNEHPVITVMISVLSWQCCVRIKGAMDRLSSGVARSSLSFYLSFQCCVTKIGEIDLADQIDTIMLCVTAVWCDKHWRRDQLRLVWPDDHFQVICNKHRSKWLTYISEAGSSLSHYLSWMLCDKQRSMLVRPNHHYPIICLYYWCDVEVKNQLTLVWPDHHINTIMLCVRTLGACDQIITIMVSFTTVFGANIRTSDQLSLVWPKNHHFLVSVKPG